MARKKLTLSMDSDVIAAAERYASERGTSVSRLVEQFLATVTADHVAPERAPVLARLRGALRDVSVDDHRQHRVEKYG